MTKPAPPAAALADVVLIAMAVLSTIILIVPIGVLATVLALLGLEAFGMAHQMLSVPSLIGSIAMTPTMLLIFLSAAFLVGYTVRARWAPVVVSILALLWGLTASGATLMIPLLGVPGGLPMVTILMMIPGLIGPVLMAAGMAGFMLTNDRVRARFAGRGRSVDRQAGR